MKKPKITDFTPDYTRKGGTLYTQYTIAQDKYIDYLEKQINLSGVIEKLKKLKKYCMVETLLAGNEGSFSEMCDENESGFSDDPYDHYIKKDELDEIINFL